jgi:hypothetical protein
MKATKIHKALGNCSSLSVIAAPEFFAKRFSAWRGQSDKQKKRPSERFLLMKFFLQHYWSKDSTVCGSWLA